MPLDRSQRIAAAAGIRATACLAAAEIGIAEITVKIHRGTS
jgi:hypothetical protein